MTQQPAPLRTPYDDPTSPADLAADCRAATAMLSTQSAPEQSALRPMFFDAFPEDQGKQLISVDETAAALARAIFEA